MIHTYIYTPRAGLRGGQIGQLPGAPNFGGPMNYLRHFFYYLYEKKNFLNYFSYILLILIKKIKII